MSRPVFAARVARYLMACGMLGLCLCIGCAKSVPSGTVTGTVTLEGKPVPEGCTVTFLSDKYTAVGKVGAGGAYTLLDAGKPKIPAATYKVGVMPSDQRMSDAEYEKMMAAGSAGNMPPPPAVIPDKFQNPATSGLSFTVKEGPNTIDIELKK
jgi:hypothetical protein